VRKARRKEKEDLKEKKPETRSESTPSRPGSAGASPQDGGGSALCSPETRPRILIERCPSTSLNNTSPPQLQSVPRLPAGGLDWLTRVPEKKKKQSGSREWLTEWLK
jgi:hypothetical protein